MNKLEELKAAYDDAFAAFAAADFDFAATAYTDGEAADAADDAYIAYRVAVIAYNAELNKTKE